MAEALKNIEKTLRASRGFYVANIRQDLITGNVMGVATWIGRDMPYGGTRVRVSGSLTRNHNSEFQTTLDGSRLENVGPTSSSISQVTPSNSEQGASTVTKKLMNDQLPSVRNESLPMRIATENANSTLQVQVSKYARVTEQRGSKASYVDPYDSYLL